MKLAKFEKLSIEDQEAYLKHLINDYKAVRMNIAEMLDISPQFLTAYLKKNMPWFKFDLKNHTYEKCKEDPGYIAEYNQDKRYKPEIKFDCFGIRYRNTSKPYCECMTQLICKKKECSFYRNKGEYEAENLRLYGNKEGKALYRLYNGNVVPIF